MDERKDDMVRKLWMFALILGLNSIVCAALRDSTGTFALWRMDSIVSSPARVLDDDTTNPARNHHLFLYNGPTLTSGYDSNALLFDGVNDYGKTVYSIKPTDYLAITVFVKFDLPLASIPEAGEYIIGAGSIFQIVRVPGGKIWLGGSAGKIKGLVVDNTTDWFRIDAVMELEEDGNTSSSIMVTNLTTGVPVKVKGNLLVDWSTPQLVYVGSFTNGLYCFKGKIDDVKISTAPAPVECGDYGYNHADFDKNCSTDFNDFIVLADQWLAVTAAPQNPAVTDIDKNQITNFADFSTYVRDLDYTYLTADELIALAGNADDDESRLELLRALLPKVAGTDMESELLLLLPSIDRWVNHRHLHYCLYIGDFDYNIPPSSPLYPILTFYKARLEASIQLGTGEYDLTNIVPWMNVTTTAFPQNRIARMYLGEALPSPYTYTFAASDPSWAKTICESLERTTDVLQWWVSNRQRSDDGLFGGGMDDDVEMWRNWMPILIGFDDPNIQAAEELLANKVFALPNMSLGYDDFQYDVEHTAELSADTITPMLLTEPNAVWNNRALTLADLMQNLWTSVNNRGYLQFKSTHISSNWVSTDPVLSCDTVYHPRAVQPALLYWQRTGDAALTTLFSNWMNAWAYATASTYLGKPAGIMPSAIHWQDGNPGGLQPNFPNWWDPGCHSSPEGYAWPGALGYMTNTMLLTWYMTGDSKYLKPITDMANIRMTYGNTGGAEGSVQWCAANSGFVSAIADTIAKYRFLTGNTTYDSILTGTGNRYFIYQVTKSQANFDAVIAKLEDQCAYTLRYNFEGHTGELRTTDRFFKFNSILPSGSLMYARKPNMNMLYDVVTGEPAYYNTAYFPMNAVRWLTNPRKIGVFVKNSGRSEFESLLYNFQDVSRPMGARFFMLGSGTYNYVLKAADNQEVLATGSFSRNTFVSEISFTLPSHRECILKIYK